MADVESDTLSVKRLLASKAISPYLAQRIVEADVDKNGELSLEEVLQVSQQRHQHRGRLPSCLHPRTMKPPLQSIARTTKK
jgi:hypothetical protein